MKKIVNKILSKYGYVKMSNQNIVGEATAVIENDKLKKELQVLKAQVESLKLKKPLIDVKIGDPSPRDASKRKAYVAEVAGLHRTVLEPKFKQMISVAHSILEDESNPPGADSALKGAIYSLWELINWGNAMVNEQLSYQNNESNPSSENEEEK